VPDTPVELDDLVDLKMLPAWVNEPAPGERFAQHEGEGRSERPRRSRGNEGRKRRTPNAQRPTPKSEQNRAPRERPPSERFRAKKQEHGRDRHGKDRHRRPAHRPPPAEKPLPPIAVKFLPRDAAFENVVAQIKSGPLAYSLFALARLFLEKATRHDVKLTAPEGAAMFQLGENGAISTDRQFLERSAFRLAQSDFYKVEVTETDPIKGNFTNVARDRLSGTVLGPTNHHDYQRRLRNLYEQRFSRRMSFPEFQRKIEIVSDPAVIERWKEDARKVTTYSTLREEPPQTFSSVAETEKHFEKNYLPALVRTVSEIVVDGPASREMQDRVLARLIEQEWNSEMRSPSPMMQELAGRFRETQLHVFRHRKGMLFVSSIYPRPLTEEQTAVSSQVRTIVEAIAAQPRIGRKELADKLIVDPKKTAEAAALAAEDLERAKMALASDLLWLISAGHVIEFNDGSLDLPRAKVKKETSDAMESKDVAPEMPAPEKEQRVEAGAPPAEDVVAAAVSAAEPTKQELGTSSSTTTETEIGGS
jgi:hypothetical protein